MQRDRELLEQWLVFVQQWLVFVEREQRRRGRLSGARVQLCELPGELRVHPHHARMQGQRLSFEGSALPNGRRRVGVLHTRLHDR